LEGLERDDLVALMSHPHGPLGLAGSSAWRRADYCLWCFELSKKTGCTLLGTRQRQGTSRSWKARSCSGVR
jgi:hypothetical protein